MPLVRFVSRIVREIHSARTGSFNLGDSITDWRGKRKREGPILCHDGADSKTSKGSGENLFKEVAHVAIDFFMEIG